MEAWTAVGTILGTAALLIARDWRDGKSILKRNGNNIHGDIAHLREHYNDEITPILKETQEVLKEIRDSISEVNQMHKNYEVIGIKTRECAKS